MPTVPNIPSPGATGPSMLEQKPTPENLLMAAATMHQMGKFDVPEPSRGRKKGPALKVVK